MWESKENLYHPKYWPTWLGLGFLRALSWIPLPIIAVFGAILGKIFYAIVPSRRRIALKNLEVCFPEKSESQRVAIAKAHYRLLGQSLLTTGRNWWVKEQALEQLISIEGRHHFQNALERKQNIILLAPHFLSLDIAGLILTKDEPRMLTMYQYAKNALVDKFTYQGRLRYGGTLFERKEPMRNLLKLIRKGAPFYYLPDQDAGRKGVFVPFFHEIASTYPTLGKFTQMSNAVVIPVSNKILDRGAGYHVKIHPPLQDFPVGDDIIDTTKMNTVIADMIRQMPEQYLWVHKRFKTRPQTNGNVAASKFYN